MIEGAKGRRSESWALPQLNSLCEITKEIDPAGNPIGFPEAAVAVTPQGILENQTRIKWNTRTNLYAIYGVFERLTEVHSASRDNDKLILKKIREGEILKNDKRFDGYRTGQIESRLAAIPITEADNEWFKETAWKQYFVREKRELFRLRAEVSDGWSSARRALHPFSIFEFALSYKFLL